MEAGLRTRYPPPSDRECGPLFSRDLIWEGGDVRGHTPLRGALAARAAEVASRLREGPTGEEGLRRVVALMSSITNTASLSAESAAAVPPDVADGVFDGSAASRLLRDTLAACDADAASGTQHWIGVSRGHGASPRTRPAARLLGSAAAVPAAPPAVKPFDYGLYTSTPLAAGYGLWRVYLDQYYGSDLFPLPWYTWRLTVPATATVATIDDARGWVRLMASFPRVHDGLVYPDWAGVAARYDGVRVTFPAVIATQGIAFLTPHGPTAPAFWDVESTYWLRWSFTDATLVATTV